MLLKIEVAVSENISSTERGKLLENIGSEVLSVMQYDVTEEVRLTGMEVDLLAKHRLSGEVIYVECKAYRQTLAADVILKLHGAVSFKSVSSGWLLTTGDLGKDAKGLVSEWELKDPTERRKLQFYTPQRLIELLVGSKIVCDPNKLIKPNGYLYANETYLLLTNFGRFWATPTVDVSAGINQNVLLFDAITGNPITDNKIIKDISSTDTSLKELNWVSASSKCSSTLQDIKSEMQSIVSVPASDHWSDYRPARPQDFVGRKQVISDIYDYFDKVRCQDTTTRLIAIKAPSGWGKSSILLKLKSISSSKRNKKKIYFYAVDSRAAVSRRYAELAIIKCFKNAIEEGFVEKPKNDLRLGASSDPFSDPSLQELLESLSKNKKTIVLFFDQFEEIFAKQELAPLFNELYSICTSIDSLQENIILGFSWKTDGTIPQDHPAYHMWQGISDSRREFSLTPFSPSEVASALTMFTKELNQTINPQLKRILSDHCQGYPWLLKKLCIHVYKLIKEGYDQSEILGKSLNISELFKKELEELPSNELSCIQKIAADSPAEFFQIEENYGGDTVKSLINKRLILRSGSRLILYWDIFRDYVLTGKVPQIPVSYIPQSDCRRYLDALKYILGKSTITFEDLGAELKVGDGTTDNIVRDMIMMGSSESSRKKRTLSSLCATEQESLIALHRFWKSHVVLRSLISNKGSGFEVTYDEIKSTLKEVYSTSQFAEKTWDIYVKRTVEWLAAIGIVIVNGNYISHIPDSSAKDISIKPRTNVPRFSGNFFGDAPPPVVLEVIQLIASGQNSKSELTKNGKRNSIYVLKELNMVTESNKKLELNLIGDIDYTKWLATCVLKTKNIEAVISIIKSAKDIKTKEIGTILAEKFGYSWSDATKARYGSALSVWAKWVTNLPVG
ncbi:hypothetical protein GURASL_36030 [Geotalea uraniireducens]|uniref:Restriction endonuclease type IV Mrr domain-containing protein n=1 Tax=Geotalea uraniireducens TaxID=351604 RepID=A0ABM8EQF1_9BACT|nr:restriction endonuclease [Geotalea uraniireducens]BDV44680.1 hypothetical protein GURASL_36030 [Geotalea uraniireducens]